MRQRSKRLGSLLAPAAQGVPAGDVEFGVAGLGLQVQHMLPTAQGQRCFSTFAGGQGHLTPVGQVLRCEGSSARASSSSTEIACQRSRSIMAKYRRIVSTGCNTPWRQTPSPGFNQLHLQQAAGLEQLAVDGAAGYATQLGHFGNGQAGKGLHLEQLVQRVVQL